MKIRICDFETNGTDPTDAILQVGQCDLVIDGDKIDLCPPSSMFVNAGHTLKPEARAVHHIRPKDLDGAPPVDVGIRSLIDGEPDVYCAHRATFEQQFFNPSGSKWICTLKVGRRLWPESPSHSNQCLRYFLNIDDDDGFEAWLSHPAHRAGPDCYVTAYLLKRAIQLAPIESMIQWTSEPSLLPGKVGFGKHKDVLWSQCPPDYLEWIARQPDMDSDKVHTAKHWLNRRRSDAR